MVTSVPVGKYQIGPGQPCFIIAEAGVNHNGNRDLAHDLVTAAAATGADAVKFQTWQTEKLIRPGARKADYQTVNCPEDTDQFTMLKRLELPYEWHASLQAHAERLGILFLSTPDEIDSARFLCQLGLPALKVGSAELTNRPYLRQLAGLGRPLLLSSGMGTTADVAAALQAIAAGGPVPVALLHCVSTYPAPEDELNLQCLSQLRQEFGVPVGLSDHSLGSLAAAVAVGIGMNLYEKHITLDTSLPGPDHAASLAPDAFTALVASIRRAEAMLGDGHKRVMPSERPTLDAVRRILCYAQDAAPGHRLADEDLVALRTGTDGLHPEQADTVVGRILRRPVQAGDLVQDGDWQA